MKLEPLDDYRVAAHARLDVRGRGLDVYVTHLHHTDGGAAVPAEQVRHLLRFVGRTRGRGALVLGGDLNAPPGAPELRPLRRALRRHVRRAPPGRRGHDAEPGDGACAAAHRPHPRRPARAAAAGASEVFLDAPTAAGVWASDHFGLWTRFRWTR